MWLFFICNENVRMDGTSVTSVQRGDFQAMRNLMSVSLKKTVFFHVRSAYGPMNAKCVLIQSCKVLFVCTWLWVKKIINHSSKCPSLV